MSDNETCAACGIPVPEEDRSEVGWSLCSRHAAEADRYAFLVER